MIVFIYQAMGFMIRSLTGDWKFWIYFDVDMKLKYIEEFYEKIGEFESTSAIVKSITCDQAGENRKGPLKIWMEHFPNFIL